MSNTLSLSGVMSCGDHEETWCGFHFSPPRRVLGTITPWVGLLTDGSSAVYPLPSTFVPVVVGNRLANHSGGSVRDSHPLPLFGSFKPLRELVVLHKTIFTLG